ncbi:unnamed protein product [Mytilus coruscus]|uniref:Uncharacterized protein n=1 Tax=Mytilus coruscus TaxID=42192 RepID=A0A6J8CAJ6_MYTCO|nr:unnamed protein product [Mytilus coruscus]
MNDVKLQKIQNLLGKAACPMLYLMDLFLSKSQTNDGLSREEVQSATQLCKDAYQMTQVTETNLQKEKVQKEAPRAGQEVPIKLPKQNSLPVSTSVHQLNRQFTFINTPDNFIGGKVIKFQENWMSLTSDNWVLDVVKGYQIEFEQIPSQNKEPNMLQFNTDETNMVQLEIALVTGQRIQTLHCVDLDFMKITKDNVIIEINEILKTSKPGKHLSPISLPAFVEDSRLCIVTVLNAYIEKNICNTYISKTFCYICKTIPSSYKVNN